MTSSRILFVCCIAAGLAAATGTASCLPGYIAATTDGGPEAEGGATDSSGADSGSMNDVSALDSTGGDSTVASDGPPLQDGPVTQDSQASDSTAPVDGPPGDSPAETNPCAAPMQPCGGTCIDTTTDPHHCGSCTRDCQTGTCTASVCDPIWLGSLNGGSASSPEAIAVDANSVYWVQTSGTGGSVDYVLLAGGTPTPLVSGLNGPSGLVLANNNFFFNVYSNGTAYCPIAGGCPSNPSYIYTGGGRINFGFADTGGGGLVVIDRSGGNLVQFTYTGSNVVTLASNIAGMGATVTGGLVFWANNDLTGSPGYIGKAQLSVVGSGMSFMPNQAGPLKMASDANNIYWTVNASDGVYQNMDIWTCPYQNCNVGTMQALAVSQPNIGGPAQSDFQSLASDKTNLYWTASKGSYGYVAECAVGGCNKAPTILTQYTNPSDAGVYVSFRGVTYDASWVYFGVADGSTSRIGKVAK
jgi:hypothetical protein